jgi:hypothetical protein
MRFPWGSSAQLFAIGRSLTLPGVTGLEGLPRQVVKQDLAIENGRVVAYRTKVKVSFKYEGKG